MATSYQNKSRDRSLSFTPIFNFGANPAGCAFTVRLKSGRVSPLPRPLSSMWDDDHIWVVHELVSGILAWLMVRHRPPSAGRVRPSHGLGEGDTACHAWPHGACTQKPSEQPGVVGARLCGVKAVVPPSPPGGYNWLHNSRTAGTAPCPSDKLCLARASFLQEQNGEGNL